MKLSKRFKVGVFSWIILITYFISDNLWIEFITFEVLMAFLIYDGILTKKNKLYQLVRGIVIVIFGLFYMTITFQKIHNNSIKNFNKNYEEKNISTTSSPTTNQTKST